MDFKRLIDYYDNNALSLLNFKEYPDENSMFNLIINDRYRF